MTRLHPDVVGIIGIVLLTIIAGLAPAMAGDTVSQPMPQPTMVR